MNYKIGTADGPSGGPPFLGIGEPWPVYLEGMEECFIFEPLDGRYHSFINKKIGSSAKEGCL